MDQYVAELENFSNINDLFFPLNVEISFWDLLYNGSDSVKVIPKFGYDQNNISFCNVLLINM